MLVLCRKVDGSPSEWTVHAPNEKLSWRAQLPGASSYDRAAHALRVLTANGADGLQLLPLALPASWLVNARATSRAFKSWNGTLAHQAWALLLERLGPMTSLDEWLELPASARGEVGAAIGVLANGKEGATLCAVTKVLALLRPQLVPLMDDAAIAFALGIVDEPETPDDPRAPASAFAPMLDWFAEAVRASEDELVAIATRHTEAVLDAPQTLDRLLWFESSGHRIAREAGVVLGR